MNKKCGCHIKQVKEVIKGIKQEEVALFILKSDEKQLDHILSLVETRLQNGPIKSK